MKSLKNIPRYIVIVTLCFLVFSCDSWLDINPQGSLSGPVIQNEQGVRALLIGAYGGLNGAVIGNAWRSSPDNWVYGSVVGGDAHKGSHAADQSQILQMATFQTTSDYSFLNDKWRALYEGISRANAVLRILGDVQDMTTEAKAGVEGEARFLRGHYYFELRRMFNLVPWIDETTTDYFKPNDEEIWPNIEADFKFAMDNLPAVQSEIARANSWAAASYLAKTYVYQEKWQEAKALFDNIIANGVTTSGIKYNLFENFRYNFEVFAEGTSPEAVFSVHQVGVDGSGGFNNSNPGQVLNFPYNSPFLCCGFYQPTQDLVNSFRTNEEGLPYIYTYNDEMVTSDASIGSNQPFHPYEGNLDPRIDWTIGRRGVPFLDWGPHPGLTWVRQVSSAGPYHAKKNIYWRSRPQDANIIWAPGTAINVHIIRFADVLLMAAEAEAQLNNLDKAREYVNQIRRRALNSEWVNLNHNRAYAKAIVSSEAEMLALDLGASDVRAWVVREDTESTFVYLGGVPSDIKNWNEYYIPNYQIEEYTQPFTGKEQALDVIYFERKLELALEGHRFFDLVRTGKAESFFNAFFNYEGQLVTNIANGKFVAGKNDYYPIPQAQINLTTVEGDKKLVQNPGYN